MSHFSLSVPSPTIPYSLNENSCENSFKSDNLIESHNEIVNNVTHTIEKSKK